MNVNNDLNFLTVDEAAERLRLQPVTIRLWIRNGKLPAFRAGRRVLLRVADLAAMVEPLAPSDIDGVDDGKEDDPAALRFVELKAWSMDWCRRQGGVVAGTALPDSVLMSIAKRHPRSEVALRQVTGMGAARMANFAAELLVILCNDDDAI